MNVTLKDWQKILSPQNVKIAEPLAGHTSIKIGGLADWFVTPTTTKQLINVLQFCKQRDVEYFIIGAGSNCLISDNGFAGVVISLEKFKRTKIEGEIVLCDAGVRLPKLISLCFKNSLSGLEFAVGIPASCGGAIYMNAGAFGHEIADLVEEVWVLDGDKVKKLSKHDCDFSYRQSRFMTTKQIILKVKLKLVKATSSLILENMQNYLHRRLQMQPQEPSAGSVFKRTANFPAGFLIEQAGLKGLSIGDAKISPVHANFIVNLNGATCKQVLNLIEIARNEVFLQFGIELEPEIILIGEKYEDLRRLPHS